MERGAGGMERPRQWGIGAAEAARLDDILQDLRGHPRLSAWEELFIASLQRALAEHGPRAGLTDKQREILGELRRRLAAPAVEEAPDL